MFHELAYMSSFSESVLIGLGLILCPSGGFLSFFPHL